MNLEKHTQQKHIDTGRFSGRFVLNAQERLLFRLFYPYHNLFWLYDW